MHVVKIAIASLALACSGVCLFDAQSGWQALPPIQAHRSIEHELRRMQQQPEQALVLWIAADVDGRSSEIAPVELGPARKSVKRVAKSLSWSKGAMPNLAEAR